MPEGVTLEYLSQRLTELEDSLRNHRHTGFDLTQHLNNTTITRSVFREGNMLNGALSTTISSGDDIQSAINKLHAQGGGYLYLQAGTYKMTTNLVCYSSISIIGVSPTATLIDWQNSALSLSFAGTGVYSTGTITSITSGINVVGSGTAWLTNVTPGQTLFLGTRSYVILAVVDDTHITLAEGYGDNVTLPGAAYRICTQVTDVAVKNIGFKNASGTSLTFADCRRIALVSTNFLTNSIGYTLSNCSEIDFSQIVDVGNSSDGCRFTNVGLGFIRTHATSSNGGHGVKIDNMKDVYFLACASTGNTSDGFNITSGSNMQMTVDASGNGGQGVEEVSGCSNIDFISGRMVGNTSDGIKLTATSDDCRFFGVDIQSNGGYGINIAASTCDNNIITTCSFASNTSGAVNDSGTGTVIRGNVGVVDNGTSSMSQFSVLGLGGDGSDGAAVFNGTDAVTGASRSGSDYTLTRDVFYTDMTISTGVTVNPAGYRIFGTGTLTLNGTGKIFRNGNAGSNGVDHTGGAGGAALADGYLKGSLAGTTGGTADNAAPTVPGNGANTANSIGSSAAASGTGGTGSNGAGSAPGTAGTATAALTTPKTAWQLHQMIDVTATGATLKYDNSASAGAGGYGGRGNTVKGGGGGGTGSAGGIVAIYFKTISVGASALITVNGGNGGNGGNGNDNGAADYGGGGAGGAGGNGGQLILVYGSYTNLGTVTATGGTGGTGGTGRGGGAANGEAGTNGTAGNVRTFAV